jgi:hypothetical protein
LPTPLRCRGRGAEGPHLPPLLEGGVLHPPPLPSLLMLHPQQEEEEEGRSHRSRPTLVPTLLEGAEAGVGGLQISRHTDKLRLVPREFAGVMRSGAAEVFDRDLSERGPQSQGGSLMPFTLYNFYPQAYVVTSSSLHS